MESHVQVAGAADVGVTVIEHDPAGIFLHEAVEFLVVLNALSFVGGAAAKLEEFIDAGVVDAGEVEGIDGVN